MADTPNPPANKPAAMRVDDAELMVMAKIVAELKPLPPATINNVVTWLAMRYGVAVPKEPVSED